MLMYLKSAKKILPGDHEHVQLTRQLSTQYLPPTKPFSVKGCPIDLKMVPEASLADFGKFLRAVSETINESEVVST